MATLIVGTIGGAFAARRALTQALRSIADTYGEMTAAAIVIVLIVAAFALAALAWRMTKNAKISGQPARDAELSIDGPVCIYLRTFYSDDGIRLPNPFKNTFVRDESPENQFLHPEEFVGRLLEPYLIVKQVGGRSLIANARFTVPDEAWRETVAQACRSAAFIVMLPIPGVDGEGHHGGAATVSELQHLAETGALAKCALIMPKAALPSKRRLRDGWENVRQRSSEFGVRLPPYDPKGAILTMARSADGWTVDETFGRKGWWTRRLGRGLLEALNKVAVRDNLALMAR